MKTKEELDLSNTPANMEYIIRVLVKMGIKSGFKIIPHNNFIPTERYLKEGVELHANTIIDIFTQKNIGGENKKLIRDDINKMAIALLKRGWDGQKYSKYPNYNDFIDVILGGNPANIALELLMSMLPDMSSHHAIAFDGEPFLATVIKQLGGVKRIQDDLILSEEGFKRVNQQAFTRFEPQFLGMYRSVVDGIKNGSIDKIERLEGKFGENSLKRTYTVDNASKTLQISGKVRAEQKQLAMSHDSFKDTAQLEIFGTVFIKEGV